MISLILHGIVPVIFVLALGFYAGRKNIIDQEGARNFSTYVMTFGLPITLFAGIFSFTPEQLENVPYLLMLVLALVVPFAIAIVLARWLFKKPIQEASLVGCNAGFPDMAYFGLPILATVVGSEAMLPVIVGNLVTSIIILPTIIFLLHHGAPESGGGKRESFGANMVKTLKAPVVWAPILGLLLVLLHVRLPDLAKDSLQVIGVTTGGIALFTLGILLSHLQLRVDGPTFFVVLMKNLAMPAFALGLGMLFHLDGLLLKGAVITAACPSATVGAMLSSQQKVGEESVPAQVLCSNVAAILTMAFWIYIVEKV
jgi:malonate transporter and related proteins